MLGIKKNRVDELIEERKERIYFKKAFIYGSIGLGIGATDFILSKKPIPVSLITKLQAAQFPVFMLIVALPPSERQSYKLKPSGGSVI